MALAASSSEVNSTKAKPRGRPLSRSIGRNTSRISPICENSVCTSVLVVLKSRFPTNTFADIFPSLSAGAARGTGCGDSIFANLAPPRYKNVAGESDQAVRNAHFRLYRRWNRSPAAPRRTRVRRSSRRGPGASRADAGVQDLATPGLLLLEVKQLGRVHLLAAETAARRDDRGDAAPGRLHASHPDPQQVLAAVPRFAGKVRRLDPMALQERFQFR